MSEKEDIEAIVRERDDLRLEVDSLKKEITELNDAECTDCDEKDALIEQTESEIDELRDALRDATSDLPHIRPLGSENVLCDALLQRKSIDRDLAPQAFSSGDGRTNTSACALCLTLWRQRAA